MMPTAGDRSPCMGGGRVGCVVSFSIPVIVGRTLFGPVCATRVRFEGSVLLDNIRRRSEKVRRFEITYPPMRTGVFPSTGTFHAYGLLCAARRAMDFRR